MANSFMAQWVYTDTVKEHFMNPRNLWKEDEDFEAVSGDFLETILIRENYEIVVSELEKMDSIYNYTLLLRMQEWKPKEIARYMNVPVDTINTRIKRGVKMLIERLEARKYSGQV